MTWHAVTIAAASLGIFVVMFVPLERMFPTRPGQRVLRPELGIDLCFFFGQYLLWSALAVGVLDVLARGLAPHMPGLHGVLAGWPLLAQGLLAMVLGDVLVYGWHRACHRVPLLWRFHKVHHSSQHLDWVAAHREHPLDGLTTQLAQNLPAIALGLRLEAVVAIVVIRGAWGLFIHSNARLPVGWLRFLMGAPELHHYHHARDVGPAGVKNFANLAPWLDVLFGTYHRPPPGPETYALGLDEPWPRGYVAQLMAPFGVSAARLGPLAVAALAVLTLSCSG